MPTIILEKIKQAAGKTYALVDASDVEMPDGSRLDAYTEGMMVIAEAVVGQVSSLDAQVKDLDNRLDEFSPGIDEATEERIAALEAQDEALVEAALATGIRLNKLETPATSVNMTGFASDGMIIETRADGTTVEHRMAFDGSGVPVGLTTIMKDDKGEIVKESETELIGFGQMTYVSAEGESF